MVQHEYIPDYSSRSLYLHYSQTGLHQLYSTILRCFRYMDSHKFVEEMLYLAKKADEWNLSEEPVNLNVSVEVYQLNLLEERSGEEKGRKEERKKEESCWDNEKAGG